MKWIFYVVPISITANALFDWILIKSFSHAGVAASTSIVLLINTFIKVKIIKHYGMEFVPVARILKQIAIAASVGLAIYFLRNIVGSIEWLIIGNIVFLSLFIVMAHDELRAVANKLNAFRRKK